MTFTTRPDITGTFGVVTSTHWIASAVGMRMLEQGGTAADAAVAMGFVLHVVEPHLNGPLGDMPALIWPADQDRPSVICGQGPAPAGATIEHFRDQGLDLVPGSGLLATVIPGAFDAWMLMLRDHGRLPLQQVLAPAIHYARHGHPVLPRVAATIAGLGDFFAEAWPSSHATWLPGGQPPEPGALMRNPVLADCWDRILADSQGARGRVAAIEQARRSFRSGFVADAIDTWMRNAELPDTTGARHRGVLRGADLAGWQAGYEAPLVVDYDGWEVWKCGPWTQGPVLLQALRLLEGSGIDRLRSGKAAHVHLVTEAMKLAYADREAYYGDPAQTDLPIDTLLSRAYAETRKGLIGDRASFDQRPGRISGYDAWVDAALARSGADPAPDAAHPAERRGDTVHIDVIDQWGNAVSATPSGGWLQSSPVVPGLGMPLNTRAQMFWLQPGLPNSLAPGRRPRTTLSPSMARAPDGTRLAFGTPGGDQQDQWQLMLLMRLVHEGLSLQQAIDAPLYYTEHAQSSFHPRAIRPGHLLIEPAFGEAAIADLRARGHALEVAEPWSIGRLTAASRRPDGRLSAAATPRLMQAYAIGR
ncbi:MAG: gamma-glutamyltransferase family protein [Marinibacterium sp.]|nr:gamma-glutamyltransferase family protein [Marinibacterium sp.]